MRDALRIVALGLAAVGALLAGRADGQSGRTWWSAQWRYRRAVNVSEVPATGLPGEEIAVATIYTGGLCRADARDVRVVGRTGGPRPFCVLMQGPGDRLRVAFALKRGVLRYYVYFGNVDADRPGPELDLTINRGVLMESFPIVGGYRDPGRIRKMIERPAKVYGRTFLPNIFIGHNPFDAGRRMVSRFGATLVAPVDGEYKFAITSTDSSFLAIDGKDLIRRVGPRWPDRDIRHNATVSLTKGPHTLELLHVSVGSVPTAVVAWQAPGDKRVWPIPAAAFAPVVKASPGPLSERGQSVAADFSIDHAGEAFIGGRYYQRYIFRELVSLGSVRNAKFRWDFGDGQTSAVAVAEHVYLNSGFHDVKLAVTVGRRTYTRENRVYVNRDRSKVVARVLDSAKLYDKLVSGYDPAAMRSIDLVPAIGLFEQTANVKAIMAIGDALVTHAAVEPDALREVLPKVARYWRERGMGDHAVKALLTRAGGVKDARAAAVLTVLAGQILLRDLSRPDEARKLFEKTVSIYSARTTDEAIRAARIGIGDAWRLKGEYAKAKAAYGRALVGDASFASRMLRRGGYARHVEEYLRTRALDDAETYLDRWESDLPADRLTGYSTLMRVRLRIKQGRWADAAGEALTLVAVNPESNYAPELLLAAEAAYVAMDQPGKARAILQRVLAEYPESSLALEARKRLAKAADK